MRDLIRLLDANANRAAEAARTLEDIARFSLDDGPLAARAKRCRHAIERALTDAGMGRDVRASHRDTPGDTGVETSAADPHQRADLTEVVSAAGSRLTQALRVIEETLKLLSSPAAGSIERTRYDAYETERQLLRRIETARPAWRVCLLLTEALCTHHAWETVARQAVDAGIDCIQVREKHMDDRLLIERVKRVIEIARPAGVAVVVNDRADLAAITGADGVHLGQTDLRPGEARRIVGDRMLIGVSCSSPEQARAAADEGADVLGIGAMYATSTKAKPQIAGPALLAAVLGDEAAASLPHLAIGGITADRATELAALGCRGVAVSSAICGATDPHAEAAAVVAAMAQHTPAAGAAS